LAKSIAASIDLPCAYIGNHFADRALSEHLRADAAAQDSRRARSKLPPRDDVIRPARGIPAPGHIGTQMFAQHDLQMVAQLYATGKSIEAAIDFAQTSSKASCGPRVVRSL